MTFATFTLVFSHIQPENTLNVPEGRIRLTKLPYISEFMMCTTTRPFADLARFRQRSYNISSVTKANNQIERCSNQACKALEELPIVLLILCTVADICGVGGVV